MPAIRRNWCIATASNHIIIMCVLFSSLWTKFGVCPFQCCAPNSFPFSRNNRSKLNALYFHSVVVVFTHQTSYYCYFICLNGRNFVFCWWKLPFSFRSLCFLLFYGINSINVCLCLKWNFVDSFIYSPFSREIQPLHFWLAIFDPCHWLPASVCM